ncbi:hypothetical protein HL658_20460 [Azospirillum sp. RWY-5-1]|uniref:O-antigen ligase domain-containing protein n=1 Tax=Azospirillum oleiclasticum TaxID=2735135 RepID=A0ABX2THP7_9PROT|nr:hypothetical protein [Azospirillum oleiclasticum]NYZ14926.1 hypothetical protein [Azospirillum oleiclasticum]NYZ22688.1 hypothetical protein [Azospirillum oleiclasticum]
MRIGALCGAVGLYGALGAPAPPSLRWIELGIAVLLLVAVGLRQPLLAAAGSGFRDGPAWAMAGTLALLWLTWVPLLRGVWQGWEPTDILRDVVPLFFLFLPLLLVPILSREGDGAAEALCGALMLAGLLFALRWWRQQGWEFGAFGERTLGDGRTYLLNAPAVLVAAIGLPALSLRLAGRGGAASWAVAIAAGLAGAVCLTALAGAAHRLALGIAMVALLAICSIQAARAPRVSAVLVLLACALLVAFHEVAVGTLDRLIEKTRLAGANARVEEAEAVLRVVSASLPSLLFGEGWGALLANPAVGEWRVSYSHTFLTYVLLKTGVLGLAAFAGWAGAMAWLAWRLLRNDPVLALVCLPPLLVPFGLHTSFKYLDTGLLLAVVAAAGCRNAGPAAR